MLAPALAWPPLAPGRRETLSPNFHPGPCCSQPWEQLVVSNFPSLASGEGWLLKFESSWVSYCASQMKAIPVPMLRISKGRGETPVAQGPAPGKTPAGGRLLPLEDVGCSSFHGCYPPPPFLAFYIPVSSPRQMKMELPVASQETGRCGFTLGTNLCSAQSLHPTLNTFLLKLPSAQTLFRPSVNAFYHVI